MLQQHPLDPYGHTSGRLAAHFGLTPYYPYQGEHQPPLQLQYGAQGLPQTFPIQTQLPRHVDVTMDQELSPHHLDGWQYPTYGPPELMYEDDGHQDTSPLRLTYDPTLPEDVPMPQAPPLPPRDYIKPPTLAPLRPPAVLRPPKLKHTSHPIALPDLSTQGHSDQQVPDKTLPPRSPQTPMPDTPLQPPKRVHTAFVPDTPAAASPPTKLHHGQELAPLADSSDQVN